MSYYVPLKAGIECLTVDPWVAGPARARERLTISLDITDAAIQARPVITGIGIRLALISWVELLTQARVSIAVGLTRGAIQTRTGRASVEDLAICSRVGGPAIASVWGSVACVIYFGNKRRSKCQNNLNFLYFLSSLLSFLLNYYLNTLFFSFLPLLSFCISSYIYIYIS